MNLLLKVSQLLSHLPEDREKSETLNSKFIVVLLIIFRIILSSILHIEHC